MQMSQEDWLSWLGTSAEERLKKTFFLVEANSFETLTLWVNHAKDGAMAWDQGHGFAVTVGNLDSRPVCVSMTWNMLDGRWVAFWNACSQVVDHVMVDAWLEENFKGTWDNGSRRASCDAMNFHHCLQALRQDSDRKRAC